MKTRLGGVFWKRTDLSPPLNCVEWWKVCIFFYSFSFSGYDYDRGNQSAIKMTDIFLSYQSVQFRSKSIKISIIESQNQAKNAFNLRNIGTPLNPTPYPLKTIENSVTQFALENAHFPYKICKSRGGTTGITP